MADYKKPDHWQQKARKEGYPARSVYKLKEIDEKFALFKAPRLSSRRLRTEGSAEPQRTQSLDGQKTGGIRVLDIGAAPGSWSLYVLRKFASANSANACLVAADLCPLSREFDNGLFDGGNFNFIQGDITEPKIREAILSQGPYSVIISDVAPSTTGNHMVDSARSLELVETVVEYAQTALVTGGNLAVKIFQGSGTDVLLKNIKKMFKTAKSFKPEACRGESVETYFVGLDKLTSYM